MGDFNMSVQPGPGMLRWLVKHVRGVSERFPEEMSAGAVD